MKPDHFILQQTTGNRYIRKCIKCGNLFSGHALSGICTECLTKKPATKNNKVDKRLTR